MFRQFSRWFPSIQFSLLTLFWVTTLVAILLAVATWTGWLVWLVFLAHVAGVFGGLWLCSHFDLGFGFADLRSDIAKCVAVSFVTVGGTYLLVKLTGGLALGVLPIAFVILLKVCWFDLTGPEILLVTLLSFVATAITCMLLLGALGYWEVSAQWSPGMPRHSRLRVSICRARQQPSLRRFAS